MIWCWTIRMWQNMMLRIVGIKFSCDFAHFDVNFYSLTYVTLRLPKKIWSLHGFLWKCTKKSAIFKGNNFFTICANFISLVIFCKKIGCLQGFCRLFCTLAQFWMLSAADPTFSISQYWRLNLISFLKICILLCFDQYNSYI